MLNRILGRRPANAANLRSPAVPDGQRVYAIGDIHGRSDLLDRLLAMIVADTQARPPAETHLVFLGDLMDRGPDSSGVIERVMRIKEQKPDQVHVLTGNHEEVFLGAAAGDEKMTRFLLRIGGRETILSYGMSVEDYQAMTMAELAGALPALVPATHRDFLARQCRDYIAFGDYLFVHAGIRPRVPMEDQKPSDMRWIRDDFLASADDHGCMVVHGHSITDGVDIRPNRIGIDTGAFSSGVLTALAVEGTERRFLQTEPAEGEVA